MNRLGMAAVGGATVLCIAAWGAPERDPNMERTGHFETVIAAPPPDVWRVFTTPDGWRRLGSDAAQVDLRPGGALSRGGAAAGASSAAAGEVRPVLAVEPGEMLALGDWRAAAEAQRPSRRWTVIRLRDLGDGRTRVTQSDFRADAAAEVDPAAEKVPTVRGEEVCEAANLARAVPEAAAASGAHAAPLEFSERIPAPPADVFRAWTTQEGVQTFFAEKARVRLERGGPYEILFDPSQPPGRQGSEGCTVLAWLPGRMLTFTWNAPPQFAHARERHTWVVVEFEPEGDATRVRLTHLGWAERIEAEPGHADEWRRVRAYFAAAWPAVMESARQSIRARGRAGR